VLIVAARNNDAQDAAHFDAAPASSLLIFGLKKMARSGDDGTRHGKREPPGLQAELLF